MVPVHDYASHDIMYGGVVVMESVLLNLEWSLAVFLWPSGHTRPTHIYDVVSSVLLLVGCLYGHGRKCEFKGSGLTSSLLAYGSTAYIVSYLVIRRAAFACYGQSKLLFEYRQCPVMLQLMAGQEN